MPSGFFMYVATTHCYRLVNIGANLSTYNFDFSAIARRAVSFIVNQKHEAYLESGQVIECEGHIVESGLLEHSSALALISLLEI